MITVPKNDFRSLPYLVSLSAIGVATIGILLGIGFLLLTHPQPAMPSDVLGPERHQAQAHPLEAAVAILGILGHDGSGSFYALLL